MLAILYVLMDLQQAQKQQLLDCYSSQTYTRLVTLQGKKSFEIALSPNSNQAHCQQLPRGVNVTVYATALIDGVNNFVPNSHIFFDFNFSTTIGLAVPCSQCVDDSYLSSDQVIVTIESAIYYTRIVMGAVQTIKGHQTNCFSNVSAITDQNSITMKTSFSSNCPQIVSNIDPNTLKSVVSADLYIVYENNEIDRFEKLQVGSQFSYSTSSNFQSNFTVYQQNIGAKALQIGIQLMQIQLYFDNLPVPLIASIQTSTMQYSSFSQRFNYISMQIQKSSAYVDIQINETPISLPDFTGKITDYYNKQIFTQLKPNRALIQVTGFSTQIQSSQYIKNQIEYSSVIQPPREPMVSFSVPVGGFGFRNGRNLLTCAMVTDKANCERDFAKLLSVQDPAYQIDFRVLFYRNDALVAAVSKKMDKVTDSCVYSASGFISSKYFDLQLNLNQNSRNCQLNLNQKVTVNLNFQAQNQTVTLKRDVEFGRRMELKLNLEERKVIEQMEGTKRYFDVVVENTIVETVQIEQVLLNDTTVFKQRAKLCVIYITGAATASCVVITSVPFIKRRVKQMYQKRPKVIATEVEEL
ncbi:Conserved_hypothetical protein [Hexamita inflata]|uniref:Transmembrane protein n=1 Tax=Hexamita inflata TaxID=28002 RepID=A0AA86VLX0_9EUKA|nr:Conserved hypothetical protein [Hexamita inflata]CAI9970439.1 Conserved hypothetical protein [Hexamita inflata]